MHHTDGQYKFYAIKVVLFEQMMNIIMLGRFVQINAFKTGSCMKCHHIYKEIFELTSIDRY